MTTIPSLDAENEIPLRHEFICTGFVERIASWARFLCLSFLFIQLLAIAINLIFPFAIDPPLFFNQLLFFLLACAAFEIVAIPIEAIKDHCIIDLQKGMVVKIYNRCLFSRVEVVAPFDEIRAIGVSSRAAPIWRNVFADSPQRYAVLVLTDKAVMSRLTDYSLSLDSANRLVKSLHESYLRDADVIYGSRNVELVIDPKMSGTMVTRHCERSALSLVDAAVLPAFQAAIGAVIVALLIAITAMVGDFIAERLFNTSLKIANQPVFQLLLTPATPGPETSPLDPPSGPPPAIPTGHQSTIAAVQQSPEPIAQVASIPATTTTPEPVASMAMTASTNDISPAALEIPASSPIRIDTPAEAVVAVVTEPEKPEPVEDIDNFIKVEPQKPLFKQKEAALSRKTAADPGPISPRPQSYVLVPLPSRIPSLDENSILASATSSDKIDAPAPVRIHLPVISQPLPVSKAPADPVASQTQTALAEASSPAANVPTAGKILVSDYIGKDIEAITGNLGKPLASIKSAAGQQLIYSGIALQTDPAGKIVLQVNLTSPHSKILGPLSTQEGLSVGSSVREARIRLGIPQENAGSPGHHFPAQGISIYPLPGDPDIIGSIKLYKKQPD